MIDSSDPDIFDLPAAWIESIHGPRPADE